MAEKPLVSVIMNCFNGEKYLREALDSVIEQTYENWELIFWDNQSTDTSAEIARNYKDPRIKYFRGNEHTTLYQARNLAYKECQGEFICLLDVDDHWKNDKIFKQIIYFKDQEVGIVYSNFDLIDEINNKRKIKYNYKLPSGKITRILIKNYIISTLTLMIRKKEIEKLENFFDKRFNLIGDFDLILRISKNCKIIAIQESLAICRWHGKNLSINKEDSLEDEMTKWYNTNKNYFDEIEEMNYYEKLIQFEKFKKMVRKKQIKRLISTLNFVLLEVISIKIYAKAKGMWRKW